MSVKTEAHGHAGHEEFLLPLHLRSRPLGTIMLWEPQRALRHLSAAHTIGALTDDLAMMETDLSTRNAFTKKKLDASAKNHADRIINANRFYQNKIRKELEQLASLNPELAAKTSNYLTKTLERYAGPIQKVASKLRYYQHIADRLGVAFIL